MCIFPVVDIEDASGQFLSWFQCQPQSGTCCWQPVLHQGCHDHVFKSDQHLIAAAAAGMVYSDRTQHPLI